MWEKWKTSEKCIVNKRKNNFCGVYRKQKIADCISHFRKGAEGRGLSGLAVGEGGGGCLHASRTSVGIKPLNVADRSQATAGGGGRGNNE